MRCNTHVAVEFYENITSLWDTDWSEMNPAFSAQWVAAHETAALAFGKPLIVEEASLRPMSFVISPSFA